MLPAAQLGKEKELKGWEDLPTAQFIFCTRKPEAARGGGAGCSPPLIWSSLAFYKSCWKGLWSFSTGFVGPHWLSWQNKPSSSVHGLVHVLATNQHKSHFPSSCPSLAMDVCIPSWDIIAWRPMTWALYLSSYGIIAEEFSFWLLVAFPVGR